MLPRPTLTHTGLLASLRMIDGLFGLIVSDSGPQDESGQSGKLLELLHEESMTSDKLRWKQRSIYIQSERMQHN